MTLKGYLISMVIATALCWASWLFIIFSVDPDNTNWVGFLLFYASIFLALIGTSAIVGFLIRFVGLKYELAFRSVKDAFRQSFLFSFLIIASLFLSSQKLFSWLNLLFLVVGLTALEYFLVRYRRGV